MDLRQLDSFVRVAEAGSFSRAAVALNLAQPTLSRQVALLERRLGQRLLVRTGRGAAPTEAGELLLVHARTMLEIARRAEDELRELHASRPGASASGCRRGSHAPSAPTSCSAFARAFRAPCSR